jgi:hypothetical protein
MLAAARLLNGPGFLEGDIVAGARVLTENEITPGTVIGPYRVMGEIGRRGMGVVYLASRESF